MNENSLTKSAGLAAVCVALVLVVAKGLAWYFSDSVSVLASAADSMLDLTASSLNLFAIWLAAKPPDGNHRFGHGKAEALAGFVQSLLISVSAGYLLYLGVIRTLTPAPLQHLDLAFYVMAGSLLLTTGLISYQRYVVRRTQSLAVKADAAHYFADILANGATLAAIGLAQVGWLIFDGIFALLVGSLVLYTAVKIGWEATRMLMDEELPDADRQAFIQAAQQTPGVHGVQSLRTWRSGRTRVILMEIRVAGDSSLLAAEKLVQQTTAKLKRVNAELDVTVVAVSDTAG